VPTPRWRLAAPHRPRLPRRRWITLRRRDRAVRRLGRRVLILPRRAAGPADCAPEPAASSRLLVGDQSLARRIAFLLVSACTLSSMLLAGGAILAALHGALRPAAVLLLVCVVADGLDGTLARRFGVSTPFGSQLDSLSDMCSFGLAAPILTYAWLSPHLPVAVVGAASALMTLCAAVRLARFNVSPKDGLAFSGLPTTTAAGVSAMAVLLQPVGRPHFLLMVVLLAVAMVSTFPYFRVGQLRRIPLWLWGVVALAAAVDVFTTFLLLVGAYLLSGPIISARRETGA
jgi:CDP-diacylglycerol--serine O-phosphatidyltransferase